MPKTEGAGAPALEADPEVVRLRASLRASRRFNVYISVFLVSAAFSQIYSAARLRTVTAEMQAYSANFKRRLANCR